MSVNLEFLKVKITFAQSRDKWINMNMLSLITSHFTVSLLKDAAKGTSKQGFSVVVTSELLLLVYVQKVHMCPLYHEI